MARDSLTGWTEAARGASASLFDYLSSFSQPSVRIGVTGLSRAGKTVFITALVHALVGGGRLPVFRALSEGRISRARIAEQPDAAVARFAYEDHLATLTAPDRAWPQSTRQISQVRVELDFQRPAGWLGSGRASLAVDIVDYPGEWLLDLPLLSLSYADWSRQTLAAARVGARATPFAPFLARLAEVSPSAAADERSARDLAETFTAGLVACRAEGVSLSSLPPGRFLMPGDMAGSPALTFAPLDGLGEGEAPDGSLHAMLAKRFEAYKKHVIKPFFRDHFARLDRQIVLVDVLGALNAGPEALRDLEAALGDVLGAFRVGQNTLLSSVFAPRIDKLLFAATKADHLHSSQHDRLEAVMRLITRRALARAQGAGAEIEVVAMAAVRATREVEVKRGREVLACIAGVPMAGERLGGDVFDGEREAALFPGELAADPLRLLAADAPKDFLKFLRFRPPLPQFAESGGLQPLPHIRLDSALEFLLGDRLG